MTSKEWRTCKLSDFIDFKNGKKRPINNGQIPVFGGNGILSYTDEYNYENCIIIGRVGIYCGNVFYSLEKCWVSDNAIMAKNKHNTNIKFIYYLLKFLNLNARSIGTGQPLLTQEILNNIEILLPPLEIQEKIAKVLSSLDDKIELNNKINQNLEQQAQAIFKSWFVDFRPFGGKMPADWRIGKLGELVEITSGKRPQLKQADKDNKFDIPIIGASNIMGYTNAVLYNEPILITGRVGTHGIINKYNKQCWPSDNTLVIKSEYYEYIYQQLKRVNFAGLNRGSTQPLITQKDLFDVSIVIPTSQKIKEYEKFATQLNKSQDNLIAENKKLCSIRDTLLPKLLNNELNIDNIEV